MWLTSPHRGVARHYTWSYLTHRLKRGTVKPVIRAFTADDYGSVAVVLNSVYVDYPTTADELRFNEEHNDPRCLQRRWVAEVGGQIVGIAEYVQHVGMYHPRKFLIELAVRPAFQGKHIGAALYDELMIEIGRAHV